MTNNSGTVVSERRFSANVSADETREIIFELLTPQQWFLIAECFDGAKIPTTRVEDAFAVMKFLKGITQHNDFKDRVQAHQQPQV